MVLEPGSERTPTRMNASMGDGTPVTPPLLWFCLWDIPASATCQARKHALCLAEEGAAGSLRPTAEPFRNQLTLPGCANGAFPRPSTAGPPALPALGRGRRRSKGVVMGLASSARDPRPLRSTQRRPNQPLQGWGVKREVGVCGAPWGGSGRHEGGSK